MTHITLSKAPWDAQPAPKPTPAPQAVRLPSRLDSIRARLATAEDTIKSQANAIASLQAAVKSLISPNIVVPVNPAAPREAMLAIISQTARAYGLGADDVIGRSKLPEVCYARSEAAYLCHVAGFSMPRIGALMGGRDHSTIHAAIGKHKARLSAECQLRVGA